VSRPRKPIEQKVREGTYRKDRDGGKKNPQGKILTEVQPAPKTLDAIGQKEYISLQECLLDLGLLQKMYLKVIFLAAQAYQDYYHSKSYIEKTHGSIEKYLDERNTQNNLIYQRMEKALKIYVDLLKTFPSSPLVAQRITVPAEREKSALEAFAEEM
jgi:phage terminase small subunit